MEFKAGTQPVTFLEGHRGRSHPVIEAYTELCQLKQLYRQGWLQRGLARERCESVADHTFAVSLLALFLADAHPEKLSLEKVVLMALLHDLGEVYAGDLTPNDGISSDEKGRRERDAVTRVLAKLPRGGDYIALWEEYEAGHSPEARFVRHVDRLEMGLQAGLYEDQESLDLQEIRSSARESLEDSPLVALYREFEDLCDRRR